MSDSEKILQAIYGAVDEINPQLPPDQELTKQATTVLVGDGAVLDSLSLINLIVTTEYQLQKTLGLSVNLTDPTILENPEVTIATLGQLADTIAARIYGEFDD